MPQMNPILWEMVYTSLVLALVVSLTKIYFFKPQMKMNKVTQVINKMHIKW